jgi:ribosome maturation factor RimP
MHEREPLVPSFICVNVQPLKCFKPLRLNPPVHQTLQTLAMELTERIGQLLEEKYASDELFADCFTVDIELKPGNKLFIYADSDSGLSLEKCQKLSRHIEHILDENGWLGETYGIEVSSPGIDRPLKFPRQYVKNIGRTLYVRKADKTEYTQELKSADEAQIILTEIVVERDGKKKLKKEVETAIPYDQIEKAVVKLPF